MGIRFNWDFIPQCLLLVITFSQYFPSSFDTADKANVPEHDANISVLCTLQEMLLCPDAEPPYDPRYRGGLVSKQIVRGKDAHRLAQLRLYYSRAQVQSY